MALHGPRWDWHLSKPVQRHRWTSRPRSGTSGGLRHHNGLSVLRCRLRLLGLGDDGGICERIQDVLPAVRGEVRMCERIQAGGVLHKPYEERRLGRREHRHRAPVVRRPGRLDAVAWRPKYVGSVSARSSPSIVAVRVNHTMTAISVIERRSCDVLTPLALVDRARAWRCALQRVTPRRRGRRRPR
jgi:hypothetical protein